MTTFMRVKVTLEPLGGRQSVCKMMAVEACATWGEFKTACASKVGLDTADGLEFQWEGCGIEESDDAIVGGFVKDGDALVLHATPVGAASSSLPANGAVLPPRAAPPPPQLARKSSAGAPPRHPEPPSATVEPGRPRRASAGGDAARASRPASRTSSTSEHSGVSGSEAPVQHIPWHGQIRRGSDGALATTDRKCSCKHSKCVKLYCVCWAAGLQCNNCLCRDCFNTPENAEFLKAEQARTMARNPTAFSTKVETKRGGDAAHKVGCRCRRSHCIKKYCECFDASVRCSSQCRCIECDNQPEEPEEDGLASLASAAQLAYGLLDDVLLSPGTATAIAPYKAPRSGCAPSTALLLQQEPQPQLADAAAGLVGTTAPQRRSSTNTNVSSVTYAALDEAVPVDMRANGRGNGADAGTGTETTAVVRPELASDGGTAGESAPARPWVKGMPIPAGSSLVASLAARVASSWGGAASASSSAATAAAQGTTTTVPGTTAHDAATSVPIPNDVAVTARPIDPLQQLPAVNGASATSCASMEQLMQLSQLSQLIMLQQQQQQQQEQAHAVLVASGGDPATLEAYCQGAMAAAAGYGILPQLAMPVQPHAQAQQAVAGVPAVPELQMPHDCTILPAVLQRHGSAPAPAQLTAGSSAPTTAVDTADMYHAQCATST